MLLDMVGRGDRLDTSRDDSDSAFLSDMLLIRFILSEGVASTH
jgi:hypothetical protein